MAQRNEGVVNPPENLQRRIVTLESVEVRHKFRTDIDGHYIPQVGLFARSNLSQPIPKGSIILAEKPIVYFGVVRSGGAEEEEDDPFRKCLIELSAHRKFLFDQLYNSPELQKGGSIENQDLGRWWTNRFAFTINDQEIEAVYQHSSAIDHSCFNANARANLANSKDMLLEVRAEQDIQAGEEILIHYDYELYHDSQTGCRTKAPEAVHSDLWNNRGFSCESCVFNHGSANHWGQRSGPIRRTVLQAMSPAALLRRRESTERQLT